MTREIPNAKAFEPLKTDLKYEFGRVINGSYFRFFHWVKYRTQVNIPKTGPMIFAPNHVSYYDPPAVAVGIPFRIRFMAWDALFKVPILKQIMISYGAYPVKLQTADKTAIATTLKLLKHGEAIMIFPEGGRYDGNNLNAFEAGPARLAIQTGAALVPVSVIGALEAWPLNCALPRVFRPIIIKFHPPVYPGDVDPTLDVKARVEEINRRVAAPIRRRLEAWKKIKKRRNIP